MNYNYFENILVQESNGNMFLCRMNAEREG